MVASPLRLESIRRRLLAWYDAGHRDLPWRFPQHGADPYRVWLAEVMLQQTQVGAALPYYRRFVARWPTLEALAAADDADVFAAWSGLGYYARCKNLLAAARVALARHGRLPASLEALRALPGVGPYTAGAVASIAFAIPAPAVDGNVARVLARIFAVAGDPAAARVRARLWALAGALVAGCERPGDLNQALMELGATACRKPAPACGRCPVSAACGARRARREREIPRARHRAPRRTLTLACAVVERSGRVLLARRPPGALLGGLWALPSAEVDGAPAKAALAAEIRRAHRIEVAVGGELAAARRTLTHRELVLVAYRCRIRLGPARPSTGSGRAEHDLRAPGGSPALRWASRADLAALGVSTAMRALLARV